MDLSVFVFVSDKETGTLSLICELMEMNIYELIQGQYFTIDIQMPTHT